MDEKKPLISVIVPVYHSEKTITACVESILGGEPYENLEVLLVANGLTDEDPALLLCRELSQKWEAVRVIIRPEAGVSSARNEGIRQAKGELIRFADSDDRVAAGSLSVMAEQMQKDQSDLVVAGYEHLYYNKSVLKLPDEAGCFSIKDDPERFCRLYLSDYLNPPWNKLFRKSLIREYFEENKNLGEDLCFNLSYLAKASKVSVMDRVVYHYTQDDGGTSLSGRIREDRIDVCKQLYGKTLEFLKELGMEEGCRWAPDTKVVSTFLDEIGLIPLEKGYTPDQKKRLIRRYVKAIHSFAAAKKPTLILRYADHRILYRFAKDGNWRMVYVLTMIRSLLVRAQRKMQKV